MNQTRIYHGGGAGSGGGFGGGGGAVINQFIAFGSSEVQSPTTNMAFQNKLSVPFVATLGVRYKIEFYGEIQVPADEDGEIQGTVNGTQVCFSHFRDPPFATRWDSMNSSFWIDTTLNGAVTVNIDWRNGFGAAAKIIRRARILVTRVD